MENFLKDKRKRIVRVEKTERRPASDRPRNESPRKPFSGSNERRSYNPNFTPDNKPRFETEGERKPRFNSDKPKFGEGKPRFKDGGKPSFKPKGKPFDKSKPAKKKRGHGEYSDGTYPTFAAPTPAEEVRLNRHIATSGRCSRRDADDLIRTGRVSVNGVVVVEMGVRVKPGDVVELDGAAVRSEKQVYILMNKPKGFVTTLEDPHAEKTVIDLLGKIVKERVYPVGRLDKNSLGVLLLTNDGDLTSRLTHPSYNKKKVYQATLDRALTRDHMQQIAEGVTLEDGPIAADAIDYASETKKEIGIEIHSGRNRVVRRIFEHLGYKVMRLDRVYFAGLTKKNLKRGQWRFLTPGEVDLLRSGLYE